MKTTMPQIASGYEAVKADRGWHLVCDGQVVGRCYSTGREARESSFKVAKKLAYQALILAEDRDGIVWTDDERRQIEEYAASLRDNKMIRTLSGERSLADEAQRQHTSDAHILEGWYGTGLGWESRGFMRGEDLICAEVRRRRAARAEAFRMAQMPLQSERFRVYSYPTAKPWLRESYYHTADSLEEVAERTADFFNRTDGNKDNQYTFEVEGPYSVDTEPTHPALTKGFRRQAHAEVEAMNAKAQEATP